MTLTWTLLALSLLLTQVSTRTIELSGKRNMEPVMIGFPSAQAYSPRRFIKISKRPQSQFPLWVEFPYYDLVRLDNRPPGPSPFLEEDEDGEREDEWEDEAQQFRRSLRNNEEDSRAAADYYNQWIMSNVG